MFLTFLGVYFGFVYIVTFASEVLHLSDTASTNLLIFMLAANLPGRFLPVLISDKCIGPLNTIIPAAFLSSAVIWLWAASSAHPNQASLTVIACFYGFVSAGVQVLYAPTVYSFCLDPPSIDVDGTTTAPQQLATDKMGVRAGGIFSCIGLACLIGTPIGGALISHRVDRGLAQPFLGAQVFVGSCLLVGGGFLLASRVLKVGWAAERA
jgi:predicted MFS family arabinose efflux permease